MKHSNAFLIMYGVNFTKLIENAKPHSHPTLLENHYFNFLWRNRQTLWGGV